MWPEDNSVTLDILSWHGHALVAMDSVPLNFSSLAHDLGISITSRHLDDELECYIEPASDSWIIHVNGSKSHSRQRFSAAHAIAHLIFHRRELVRGGGCNDMVGYRNSEKFPCFNPYIGTQEEKRANSLAVSLLMPEKHVVELYNMAPDNVEGIARFLGIGVEALNTRLAALRKKGMLSDPPEPKNPREQSDRLLSREAAS